MIKAKIGKWLLGSMSKRHIHKTGMCLLFVMTALLFVGCYGSVINNHEETEEAIEVDSMAENTIGKYYTRNANFEVCADSVTIENLPLKDSFITLYRGDRVVVAEFAVYPTDLVDSVWVKVAQSHSVQGWLPERVLLQSFMPTDSVSQLI